MDRYSYPLWGLLVLLVVEGVRLDIATVTVDSSVEVVGTDGLSEGVSESAIRRKQREHLQRRVQPRVCQSPSSCHALKSL